MSKLSLVCIALLAACGGSKPTAQPAPPPTPVAPNEPVQEPPPKVTPVVAPAPPNLDDKRFAEECAGWLGKAQAMVPGILAVTEKHRYRDKVLAAGGTKDAKDLVKDFLGRPYNFKAFEKYLSK